MKEHATLFKTDMVISILDDIKTHTRRVPTPRNSYFDGGSVVKEVKEAWKSFDWDNAWVDKGPSPAGNPGPYLHVPWPEQGTTHRIYPRIQVGDHLWVKETFWQGNSPGYGKHCKVYAADEQIAWSPGTPFDNPNLKTDFKKRPSIFMSRSLSRITLEVKDVRVERVQDITEEDAIKEGIEKKEPNHVVSAKYRFAQLWNSINEKRGYGWDTNPWVWVVEFERIK